MKWRHDGQEDKMFPTLYAKNKNGAWKEWRVNVAREGSGAVIETCHGRHGGKMITDRRVVAVKKRGYKTLWDQAVAEARSKWEHKKQREGYVEERVEAAAVKRPMPMLAKTYEGGKRLVFPVCAQPKLDGLRCLAAEGVCLYSRTGCVFPGLDALRGELKDYFSRNPGCVLDGELFSSEMPFEELSGCCRRQKDPTQEASIVYHVFDVLTPEPLGFVDRQRFLPPETPRVRVVPTRELASVGEVRPALDAYVAEGHEGIILRNRDAMYESARSWGLQKLKLFREEEFVITGFKEGSGREEGMVVWECETRDKKKFSVRPEGDHASRKRALGEAEGCVGRMLTVVFQEYTREGVPRFPVSKAVRDGY